MHISRITKPLFWFLILFVIVSLACSSGGVKSTQAPATGGQSQTEATKSPEGNSLPVPTSTSALATNESAQPTAESSVPVPESDETVLGYIDTSPAVFIQPQSGLIVEISKATYNLETGGLESYLAKVKYPAGNSINLEFHDIAFNPSTGSVDAYQVAMDKNDLQGPTIEEFKSRKSELGKAVAFSVNSFAATEPVPTVSVPCQGDSNVEYGQSEGHRQVLRHVITCSDQVYTLEYSGYTYDNQTGALAGYSVHIEITQ